MSIRGKVKAVSPGDNGGPSSRVGVGARSGARVLRGRVDWLRVGPELGLSPQEVQVVQYIFEGKKLSAIAREMQLGLGTVKTYSQRAYRKLGVTDRQELTMVVVSVHLQLS